MSVSPNNDNAPHGARRVRDRQPEPSSPGLLPSEGGAPRSPICHTDEHGAPDPACWDMALDQYQRGYMLGYEQGARRMEHETVASLRRVLNQIRQVGLL